MYAIDWSRPRAPRSDADRVLISVTEKPGTPNCSNVSGQEAPSFSDSYISPWPQGDKRIPPPQITICRKSIDSLPMELLRNIFLYSTELNQVKSGRLASVCRFWRSVIITISHLWSTLRVEAYTKKERVSFGCREHIRRRS